MPLYLLALAVFAIGTSEFLLAGLVPGIAGAFAVPVAQAGYLTSAFAAGMVAGAPLMAALARSWRRRTALRCFLAVFVAMHVVAALTTLFALLIGTRLVAGVADAGFLAVALGTATAFGRPGRALAVLLGGSTVACAVGIPGGALLGWRPAFRVVALLCLPAFAALWWIPATAAGPRPTGLRAEVAVLRPLAGVLLTGARSSTPPPSASSPAWRRWCSAPSVPGASPGSPRPGGSPTGGPAGSSPSAARCCSPGGSRRRWPRTSRRCS